MAKLTAEIAPDLTSAIALTAVLNGILAAAVFGLAFWLWQWRDRLIQLKKILIATSRATSLSPRTAGYELMLKRAQIAQTRLTLAQLQARSQQLVQTLKLIRTLQTIWFYRNRRKR